MIFLPASFVAVSLSQMALDIRTLIDFQAVFGMNIGILSSDTHGTLAHYFAVAMRGQKYLYPSTMN